MLKHAAGIFTLGLLLALSACSDDADTPKIPYSSLYDFVTLDTIVDKGSTFTMIKSNEASEVTYTSSFTFPNDTIIKNGDRLIISYEREGGEPYTTGPITLYGYRRLDNYPQLIVLDTIEQLTGGKYDPIKIQSLTRTGKYLNMQAQLSCQTTSTPKYLCLTINEQDADNAMPKLHIMYMASQPGLNYFTGYASWDLSALLRRPTCQAIEVIYDTPTGKASQIFTINN